VTSFSVTIEGLAPLVAKLGEGAAPVIGPITRAIGELVRKKLAREPKRNTGPVKWASAKQRTWYHAARGKAGLPLRYTRNSDPWSQRIGPSWAVERYGDMDALVGTRVTYAKWVQSQEFQQPMHKATGWVTEVEAGETVMRGGAVERIVNDAVKQWW